MNIVKCFSTIKKNTNCTPNIIKSILYILKDDQQSHVCGKIVFEANTNSYLLFYIQRKFNSRYTSVPLYLCEKWKQRPKTIGSFESYKCDTREKILGKGQVFSDIFSIFQRKMWLTTSQ